MTKFHVVTLHPKFVGSYLKLGVCARAERAGVVEFNTVDLRKHAVDKHGTVDDRPYGGGDGMVMRPDALATAVSEMSPRPMIVVPSPGGRTFDQDLAVELEKNPRDLAFVCGRFGGIDQRFIDRYADLEVSMGAYVVSGGELPALMMIDAIIRLMPGVLGNEDSAANDSFSAAYEGMLEHPLYTRPEVFEGEAVPDVLKSGDHRAIEAWRAKHRRGPS